MLIPVFGGKYRMGLKRLAYRNDFCLVCNREQISVKSRSFHAAHLYGIPFVPMGWRIEWWCTGCNTAPSDGAAAKAVVGALSVVALLVAVGSAMLACFVPALVGPIDWERGAPPNLTMWLVPWVLAIVAFVVARRMPVLDLEALRKPATPTSETNCARCSAPLGGREVDGVYVKHCASCALDRAG